MHTQRVLLKVDDFDEEMARRGLVSNNAIGKVMGVAHTTIADARNGGSVGGKFIARAIAAFEVSFDQFFKVAA